jgi:hypothetical protein
MFDPGDHFRIDWDSLDTGGIVLTVSRKDAQVPPLDRMLRDRITRLGKRISDLEAQLATATYETEMAREALRARAGREAADMQSANAVVWRKRAKLEHVVDRILRQYERPGDPMGDRADVLKAIVQRLGKGSEADNPDMAGSVREEGSHDGTAG